VRDGALPDVIRCLLNDLGAFVDGQSGNGHTPLCFAANAGFVEIVMLLLNELNADVTKGDKTPLHAAGNHGHVEVIRLLVNSKADLK
jgi:ankyrin repeat protein